MSVFKKPVLGHFVFLGMIATIAGSFAVADEPGDYSNEAETRANSPSTPTTTMDKGAVTGSYGFYHGEKQGAIGLQGMKTTITNAQGTMKAYGTGHGSIEVGTVGIAFNAEHKSGLNFWTRKGSERVVPLIGIEPFNLALGTSIGFDKLVTEQKNPLGQTYYVERSNPHRILGREPFIEWSPMASVGIQVLGDTCKAMFALRGGVSLGTLGDGGLRTAYGAGVVGVCEDVLQFSADVMRISTKSSDVDMASVRAFILIPGQSFGIGAVVDGRDTKDSGQSAVFSMPGPSSKTAEFVGKIALGGRF